MKRKILCILLSVVLLLTMVPAITLPALAASELKASDDCIDMLKALEGFSKYPYWDYLQYSVGYGTSCPSDADYERYKAEGISEEEAEMLLRQYVEISENWLNKFIDKFSVNMNQNQFDALILFTYNCGTNWMSKEGTFRTAVIEGATGNDFLYGISLWCRAGDRVQTFLLDRRMKEANVYLKGVYSTAVPDYYSYVRYDANGGEFSVSVQGYDVNDPAEPVSVARRDGYEFLGWSNQKEGGEIIEKLDASTKGAILYAQWKAVEAPDETVPDVTVPDVTQPDVTEPEVTEPDVTEPEVTTPETTEPEPTVPETTVPETTVPETTVPETTVPEETKPEATEPEATEPEATEPPKPQSVSVTVTANYVNIRKGPGTGYAVVNNVNSGKKLEITETASGSGYEWGKFSGGWICLKYTNYDQVVSGSTTQKPATQEKKTGTIVDASVLRIRSGAGTSYSIVGYLSSGIKVEILEQKTVNGTTWGRISKGWISMDYVKLDSTQNPSTPSVDPKPDTPPATEPETPKTVSGTVKKVTALLIRKGAGTTYGVAGYLYTGDKVEILEQKTVNGITWGKISKGWISMEYVNVSSTSQSGNQNSGTQNSGTSDQVIATGSVINTNSLRIRSNAGTDQTVLGYLTMGTKVSIYEKKTVGSMIWGRIDKGWISLDYVKLDSGNSTTTQSKTVTASSLRIRSGAGTGNTILGYLSNGAKVTILEEKTVNGTPWGRIDKGWICLDYVK